MSETPNATSFAAKEVANVQKRSLISACGEKELALVISNRVILLSITHNTHMKGEEHLSEISLDLVTTPHYYRLHGHANVAYVQSIGHTTVHMTYRVA